MTIIFDKWPRQISITNPDELAAPASPSLTEQETIDSRDRAFSDRDEAGLFLRSLMNETGIMDRLREVLDANHFTYRRQDDDEIIDQVAALLTAGRLRLTERSARVLSTAPGPAPPPVAPVPPVRPPPPKVPGNLHVTVINDDDKSPQSGLEVKIQGPDTDSKKSDLQGKAAFNGILPGSYTINHADACFTAASASAGVSAAQTATAELHVRHIHAIITIKELAFTGNNVIEKDTTGNFGSPEWVEGRAAADQAPVAYARKKNVAFTAKFKVTKKPCRAEPVQVKGSATFGSAALEWTGTVTVNPGDAEVSLALTSNNPLPDAVGLFDSSNIAWEMNPGGQGWAGAGTTSNIVYVTLANPSGTPNYWTLLDVSCRGAAGETSEAGVIAKAFEPLKGRAISRKRDSHDLTYWLPAAACTATTTKELLQVANGAGQCGSWAEFLVDMYKVHGITSAHKVLVVRTRVAHSAGSDGFLVKHWIFDHPPASKADAYTHFVPSKCRTGTNIPGQRNATPPPAFFNHFIVRADGKFWDPSYGAGAIVDQLAWENAAIDGLFTPNLPAVVPPGTTLRTGFEKSLNATTKLLEFWDLATSAKL